MNLLVKSMFLLLVIASFFASANAAMAVEQGTRNEAHPDKCFSSSYNIAMEIGKTYQIPEACGSMTCDDSLLIEKATCGKIDVGTCKLSEEDLSMPYPDCCPQPICDKA